MKLSRIFRRSHAKKSSLGNIPEKGAFSEMKTFKRGDLAEDSHDNKGGGPNEGAAIEWELRPGGMLVQKRESSAYPSSSLGRLIKVKVSYGPHQHDVTIPPASNVCAGDLKWALAKETGLQPKEQRLIFKGKEREDNDYLHIAGVEDQAKIILIEDPASKERKMQEMSRDGDISKACHSITLIREEVDKLSVQFATLERLVNSGRKAADSDFVNLSELLTRQLLKLDMIQEVGEAKVQRRLEVKRVQKMVEAIDGLKVQNSHPLYNNSVVVTAKWETFDSGSGRLSTTPQSSTTISTNWEVFE